MIPRRSFKSIAAPHVPFALTAVFCLVVFGWMLTYGTFRFVAEDEFGSFYDHQAISLLHGHWDVPEPALAGEAFVVAGKNYGYFGPTPSLLRLPFALFGAGIGRLTRAYMMLDYAACLVGGYRLLLWAVRRRAPAKTRPAHWQTILLTLAVGLGSTVFFLGSRPYVYHEAILCGVAFALWSLWCSLRFLDAPHSRWWLGALACGVLSVHARPPLGLSALTFLGVVALVFVVRALRNGRQPSRRLAPERAGPAEDESDDDTLSAPLHSFAKTHRQPTLIHVFGIGVASIAGILSFNALSYLKFGTFDGCPLRLKAEYTPQKLAEIDGRNFHLGNLRFNADVYLFRPVFNVQPRFPFFYLEFINRKLYPESKIAYRDATLALPWAMPGLCFLALIGGLVAAVYRGSLRQPLALLFVAGLPAAVAMLTAVAVTQRYTADFLPPVIGIAAFGVAALPSLSRRLRTFAVSVAVALTLASIAIAGAITLHHQRAIVWGVPGSVQQEYAGWRTRIDGMLP
ncbi:MAG: hypothetical protein V4773_06795 [Verrucomicrobiota bacterium]